MMEAETNYEQWRRKIHKNLRAISYITKITDYYNEKEYND